MTPRCSTIADLHQPEGAQAVMAIVREIAGADDALAGDLLSEVYDALLVRNQAEEIRSLGGLIATLLSNRAATASRDAKVLPRHFARIISKKPPADPIVCDPDETLWSDESFLRYLAAEYAPHYSGLIADYIAYRGNRRAMAAASGVSVIAINHQLERFRQVCSDRLARRPLSARFHGNGIVQALRAGRAHTHRGHSSSPQQSAKPPPWALIPVMCSFEFSRKPFKEVSYVSAGKFVSDEELLPCGRSDVLPLRDDTFDVEREARLAVFYAMWRICPEIGEWLDDSDAKSDAVESD